MGGKTGNVGAKASLIEVLVYGMGDIGANLCWAFMAAYITMYYTDSVGISGAVAGTIMLVARVFDGISDVVFAAIIDKCHMKLGKVRPWFIISAPLLGIGLYACFHVPQSVGVQGKTIYIFVTYTFLAAVAFTIYNLAYSAILPLMTLDEGNRNVVSAIGRFFTLGGTAVINYVTPLLLILGGGERNSGAWSKVSLIYAILCTIFVALMGIVIKEKEAPALSAAEAEDIKEKATKKESFIANLKIVLSTKYTWLLIVLFIAKYFMDSVYSVRTYYYRDVLGDLGYYSIGALLAYLPSLFVLPVIPYLFKKLERRKIIIIGMIIYIAASLIWMFIPNSLTIAYICTAIMAMFSTPLLAALFVYVADIADYLYYKKNKHLEHIVGMTSSIGTKIGTGVGSAIIGWGLSWCAYEGTKEIQSAGTQNGIIMMTTLLPLACAALVMLVIYFLDIEKRKKNLDF